MKIILNHNNLYFCSGPCNILSPEYSIVDYNNNYLFELKPYDGNRYPKITYRLPNKDTLEIINCRICAECHKTSLDLMEDIDVFDGLDDIEDLKGFDDLKDLKRFDEDLKGFDEDLKGFDDLKDLKRFDGDLKGFDDLKDLKGFDGDLKSITKNIKEYTGLYVIKKFILLECCTEEAKEYIKNV